MATTAERRRAFRRLHEGGCFVIPNPWDVGSARYLQHLGFHALATTSAGAAFAMGLPDSDRVVPCDAMLAHVRNIVETTDVPVNADFASGYAAAPEEVAANVRRCIETGVAGLSVEDASGDPTTPLHELGFAADRIRGARGAIDAVRADVVLTARAECFVVGSRDLDDVIRRLQAYAEAGADCLYAPGLSTREQIAAVVAAVAPRPVNVLVGGGARFTVSDLASLGVRRISVGSGLARAAWSGFARAAREIAAAGRFDAMADATPYAELNTFFREDVARRTS